MKQTTMLQKHGLKLNEDHKQLIKAILKEVRDEYETSFRDALRHTNSVGRFKERDELAMDEGYYEGVENCLKIICKFAGEDWKKIFWEYALGFGDQEKEE